MSKIKSFNKLFKHPHIQAHFKALFKKDYSRVDLVPSNWVTAWAAQKSKHCVMCFDKVSRGMDVFHHVYVCGICSYNNKVFRTVNAIGARRCFELYPHHLSTIDGYNFHGICSDLYRYTDVYKLALRVHGSEEGIARATKIKVSSRQLSIKGRKRRFKEVESIDSDTDGDTQRVCSCSLSLFNTFSQSFLSYLPFTLS